MKKNLYIGTALTILFCFSISKNSIASEPVEEAKPAVAKMSEEDIVDVLLGQKKGPDSPMMMYGDDTVQVPPKFDATSTDTRYRISQPADNLPPQVLDETIEIRHFAELILQTGNMAGGKGKRLIAKQFSIEQSEANRLHVWALRMVNSAQEVADTNARLICQGYARDKNNGNLDRVAANFNHAMEQRSIAVNSAWKNAEVTLIESVDSLTYRKALERMGQMTASRTSGSVEVVSSEISLENENSKEAVLQGFVKEADDYCAFVLAQPK